MILKGYKGKILVEIKWILFVTIAVIFVGIIIGNRFCIARETVCVKNDLSFLLGNDFSEAKQILGESVPIISENTRYFEQSGISIVYNPVDERIIYIDIDGANINNSEYGLRRISVGMTRRQVKKLFKKDGFEPGDTDSDFWGYDFADNGIKKELSVEFNDDIVIMVTFKEVN